MIDWSTEDTSPLPANYYRITSMTIVTPMTPPVKALSKYLEAQLPGYPWRIEELDHNGHDDYKRRTRVTTSPVHLTLEQRDAICQIALETVPAPYELTFEFVPD